MKIGTATAALALIGATCLAPCHAEEAETSGTASNGGSSPGVVQKVENGAKRAAEATERGVKRGAAATKRGVEWAADGVKRGAKATGHAVNSAASKVTGSTKTAPPDEGAAAAAGQ